MPILFPLKDVDSRPLQPTGEFAHSNFREATYAVDFECPVGTPVVAAEDGGVIFVKDDSDRVITPDEYIEAKAKGTADELIAENTNRIGIEHPDGTYTEYVHLGKGTAKVKFGDKVARGQIIATTGLSGCMDKPHLYFNRFRVTKSEGGRQVESIPLEIADATRVRIEEETKRRPEIDIEELLAVSRGVQWEYGYEFTYNNSWFKLFLTEKAEDDPEYEDAWYHRSSGDSRWAIYLNENLPGEERDRKIFHEILECNLFDQGFDIGEVHEIAKKEEEKVFGQRKTSYP